MELGVPNPVPALDTPAVVHQLQQGFWRSSQAGEEQVSRPKWLAITDASAVISTIQLVPIQASRMCSGACFARNIQVMLRPWPIS